MSKRTTQMSMVTDSETAWMTCSVTLSICVYSMNHTMAIIDSVVFVVCVNVSSLI